MMLLSIAANSWQGELQHTFLDVNREVKSSILCKNAVDL